MPVAIRPHADHGHSLVHGLEERQDDAARVLMLMLEQDLEQYGLSDAQLGEVEAAIADTDAGNFASQKEIDAILNHSWA